MSLMKAVLLAFILWWRCPLARSDEGCPVQCPGRLWPPLGFVEDEVTLRCSFWCAAENATKEPTPLNSCLRGCDAGAQVSNRTSDVLNPANLSTLLIQQQPFALPGDMLSYLFSAPTLNASTDELYYLVIVDEERNRTAFRRMEVKDSGEAATRASFSRCSAFQVSYTVDTDFLEEPLRAIFSTLTVGPDPPSNVRIGFEEDKNLTQRAILSVSWDLGQRVISDSSVCLLQLTLEVSPESVNRLCPEQENYTALLDKNSTEHTISATPGLVTSPPLYDCAYNLAMKYLPGGRTENRLLKIKYSGPKSVIDVVCRIQFNPHNQAYDLLAKWNVSNPLAEEVISSYETRLFRFNSIGAIPLSIPGMVRTVQERRVLYEQLPYFDNSRASYRLVVMVFKLDKTNPNYYRRTLLPDPLGDFHCKVQAPPVKPSRVHNASLSSARHTVQGRNDVYEFTIEWETPEFSNGRLTAIQLRVLDPATTNGVILLPQSVMPHLNSYDLSLTFNEIEETADILHLQVRAQNEFDLYSDWSEAVVLNLTSVPVLTTVDVTTLSPPTTPPPSSGFPVYGIVVIVVGVAVVLALVLLILFVALRVHHGIRLQHFKEGDQLKDGIIPLNRTGGTIGSWPIHPFKPIHSMLSFDPWEIQHGELSIDESAPLGKGCYGEVYRGTLSGRRQRLGSKRGSRLPRYSLTNTVAVKRLQRNATTMEKSNFLKEIEMMKSVSKVDNQLSNFVVKMLGCTISREPMILVLEFMEYGNLLDYLRVTRNKTSTQIKPAPYLEPKGAYSELAPGTDTYQKMEALEIRNLLEFARQIAAGMEYLSSLDIIHRDLACRNILVGDDRNLKISDFGMSRYLMADEVYINTSHGLLPIRWMSVESLFKREFTSASDVWSYGIVLWEICTLGGYPYHNYANKDISALLHKGYRMRRPQNCSEDIYDVMLHCWSEDAEERPMFSELHKLFDRFLGIHIQDRYPYIEIQNQPYRFDRLAPETGQGADEEGEQQETPIDLSDTEEDEGNFQGTTLQLTPVPLMSRSKLSMLSSSTVHLEQDEGIPLTTVDGTRDSPNGDSTHLPHLHSSYENTAESRSFREDLMSHFERRLSDLGPRSKYPYLQRIAQQNSESGTGSLESTSQSEEMLTRLPMEREKSVAWWKYYAGLKAARSKQPQNRSGTVTGQEKNKI